jgi:uroporphyrinogen-III synthase
VLPDSLAGAGAEVDVVALYDTVQERLDEQQIGLLNEADYVTFTSSSTVRRFLDAIGGLERWPSRARAVSIGPITTNTARELGLRVDLEAARHDIGGIVDVLVADAHIQPMTTRQPQQDSPSE